VAVEDAREGEDVGVKDLKGLIPLNRESVRIVKVPSIEAGGSRSCDAGQLKRELEGLVGAAGIEALAALHRAGARPDVQFAAVEALAEAGLKGVRGTLVVTADVAPQAIQKLEAAGSPTPSSMLA